MTTHYMIQYTEAGSTERQPYMTYENPRSEYDTADQAAAVIQKVRQKQTNVLRTFYVVEVSTNEYTWETYDAVQQPPPPVEDDFTVVNKRDMGIMGAVPDEQPGDYEHGDGGVTDAGTDHVEPF